MSTSTSFSDADVVDITGIDDRSQQSSSQPQVSGRQARVRLALVNDYELILEGLQALLAPFANRLEVVEIDIRAQPSEAVDIALFDPYGHANLGLDEVRVLAANPNVGAVAVYTWQVLTGQADQLLEAGADAVLAKSLSGEMLVEQLERVARGETVVSQDFRLNTVMTWPGADLRLTERESEVVTFLASGMSNRDIAGAMRLSENTVKTHLKSIFQKIGVSSRAQAVARIVTDPAFHRATRHPNGSS